MDLLDKLRVVLHEEGDGLHQLRLSERRHLVGGGWGHPVVHQAGRGALGGSAAGESLHGEVGDEILLTEMSKLPQEREASLLCCRSPPPAAPSPSLERTCG